MHLFLMQVHKVTLKIIIPNGNLLAVLASWHHSIVIVLHAYDSFTNSGLYCDNAGLGLLYNVGAHASPQ